MPIRKPKQFEVQGHVLTVDAEDFSRLRSLIPGMTAVEVTPRNVVFLVNHGTQNKPAYQPLPAFIACGSVAEYWVLRDRTDPGDHRKANLRRA